MESFQFTFKNTGELLNNDVVYPGLFDFEKNRFNFSLVPKTNFWRFGIRISKTVKVEFFHPADRYKNPEFFDNYIDIHIATGEWDNINWSFPTRFQLVQYNLPGYEHLLVPRSENYIEFGKIRWGMYMENGFLKINGKAEGCPLLETAVNIPAGFHYFKVFAWSDQTAFEIDATITIRDIDNPLDIGPGTGSANAYKYNAIVNTLVDGNEEQRSDLLRQIKSSATIDRTELSRRLRFEVEKRFNPESENNFVSAIRDTKEISSVRSWLLSALVWTDAELDVNREVLLKHIDNTQEPDETVRYWTLSGMFLKNVSYLDEALAIVSPRENGLIRLLGDAVKNPADTSMIQYFKSLLNSKEFESVWKILRILRIVAIPELAPDLAQLLEQQSDEKRLTYDIFYALANPAMSMAAVNLLKDVPGVSGMVDQLISIVGAANLNAVRNLVAILLPFDRNEVDKALIAASRNAALRNVSNKLMDYLGDYREADDSRGISRAGYTPDTIDVTRDLLDIREDVQTLTAVMVAKNVPPPLAIGLFGDWGTGKTFFMRSMQKEVEDIRERNLTNPETKYCIHTVQIEFNAWHYIDTNLWASLVSSIFEKLAKHVSPEATVEEQQAIFLSELGSTKTVVTAAKAEKELAENLIKAKETELQNLQTQREQKKITLKELQFDDISKLLSPEQNKQLQESLTEIGIPVAINSLSDLNNAVTGVYTLRGRVTTLFLSVVKSANKWFVIISLIVLLLLIPIALWFIHSYFDVSKIFTTVAAFVSETVAVISGIVFIMQKGLKRANSIFDTIDQSKRRIDELIAEKRSKPNEEEIKLQSEIVALNVKEKEAISRLSTANSHLLEVEERLRILQEEVSLNRFLSDRIKSEDYRKHLGIISTIRQDFELLTKRLATSQDTPGNKFKPVDRIILYIDDLDRCPSDKVMEVLQAVHLLLAYPLFVVVVGVDPRWLLHSLKSKFAAFKNSEETKDGNTDWQTTPQNFLEKIFQIPFHLRSMSEAGFGHLMNGLLSPSEDIIIPDETRVEQEESKLSAQTEDANQKPSPIDIGKGMQHGNEKMTETDTKSNAVAPAPVIVQRTTAPDFIIYEESLVIKSWETSFAERLFAIIPTPRSAKRFSNVYRILKASVSNKQLDSFEGSAELPGDFQVPMLLLSILLGFPDEARVLFTELLARNSEGFGINDFVNDLKSKHEAQQTSPLLIVSIKGIVETDWFPDKANLYAEWIPRVSRFSFELGKLTSV